MAVTDVPHERSLRVGVLTGAGNHEDIMQQLSPLGTVEWCERTDALVGAAAGGRFDAVVTGPENEDGRSIAATLIDLAALCPALPVVVHSRVNLATIEKLIGVMAVGMRTECVVRPFARLEPVLRHMCSSAYRPSAVPLLLHHVMPVVPTVLKVFVALAILTAATRRGVDELARWSGSSPRTIERRLRSEEWPGAHAILRSFIALDALWLMTEYGWSARRVQIVRGFSHPSGVTRLLWTYAGTRPSTLFEDGGFSAALDHVMEVTLGRPRLRS